jgi:hypothetical protein
LGCFAFDLSTIPPDARILSAELRLTFSVAASQPLTARAVTEPWVDGAADSSPGAASWTERTPGVAWTTPGAAPPGELPAW